MTLRFESREAGYPGDGLLRNGTKFEMNLKTSTLPQGFPVEQFRQTTSSGPRSGYWIMSSVTPLPDGVFLVENYNRPDNQPQCVRQIFDFQIKDGMEAQIVLNMIDKYKGVIFPAPDPKPISTSSKV